MRKAVYCNSLIFNMIQSGGNKQPKKPAHAAEKQPEKRAHILKRFSLYLTSMMKNRLFMKKFR